MSNIHVLFGCNMLQSTKNIFFICVFNHKLIPVLENFLPLEITLLLFCWKVTKWVSCFALIQKCPKTFINKAVQHQRSLWVYEVMNLWSKYSLLNFSFWSPSKIAYIIFIIKGMKECDSSKFQIWISRLLFKREK